MAPTVNGNKMSLLFFEIQKKKQQDLMNEIINLENHRYIISK
jgi:uncharacterized protein YebE (UPF0316 family)